MSSKSSSGSGSGTVVDGTPSVANTFCGGSGGVSKYLGFDGFQYEPANKPSYEGVPFGGILIFGRLFWSVYKKPARLSNDRFSNITTMMFSMFARPVVTNSPPLIT